MALFGKKQPRAAKTPFCSAVIVAAGSASRMGGTDKIMTELGGEVVIRRTIRAFEENPHISEILIVTREALLEPIAKLCADAAFTKTRSVLLGGQTRSDSVRAGLDNLSKKAKYVAVHDGARPLVSQEIITKTVRSAVKYGAAAPAIPVKDTIKRAKNGFILETPPREELFAVQTPQVFDVDLLRAALHDAAEKNAALTDDCSAVERIGMRVFLTEGEERNLKITTPPDLHMAESFLQNETEVKPE
ncbi:MAG: 2-C-methyl-D-erythritol 4-phosphate cytidylyltransferase [Oscillospiraceae bacterium]|nr:2-C-methyl-D-erythritol 4-phosphate cytidylyltransferase [Oscillospiraceae bacterium]MBR2977195.1 2-C-methyl-D-erythritol 4-phosphate cytidylyltransferase [Oscillospiraceae bacterium]MBR3849476.1 2-C-methyl-D-erythritol 4-phosphate cytidylyltransferase [Oscillospiraceae bacterium]